jgi:hypothetical protein
VRWKLSAAAVPVVGVPVGIGVVVVAFPESFTARAD